MMFYTGRSKPPPGTRVDHRNPMTRQLKIYFPINEGVGRFLNNVADNGTQQGQLVASVAGTPQWYANTEGPLLRWPPGANWGWVQSTPTPTIGPLPVVTYAAFCLLEQNTGDPSILTECRADSNNPQVQVYVDSGAGGKVALFFRDDAAHQVAPAASGPSILDGRMHLVALVSDGGTATLYLDAVPIQVSNISTIGQTTTDQFIIGASRASGNQWRGMISQVFMWQRGLSQDELLVLYQYPYSLLRVNS